MSLGQSTQITIGVKNLDESFAFYKKLGFRMVDGSTKPNPWIQITDDSILILLNQDEVGGYISLTYFSDNAESRVDELVRKGVNFVYRSKPGSPSFQGIFKSPDNLGVNLVQFNATKMFKPKGTTLRDIPKNEIKNPDKYPNPKCGVFGEFAHPVRVLIKSVDFWTQMGYKALSINEKPYPWAIVSDGLNTLGLHQSKDFTFPAITYFAPDMEARIARLKEAGVKNIISFQPGATTIKNGIIKTPEGQHIFLFSV